MARTPLSRGYRALPDPRRRAGRRDPQGARRNRKPHRRLWGTVSLIVLLLGVLTSVLAARTTARAHAKSSRDAAAASSAQIASTLRLALAKEQDLVLAASAFIEDRPTAVNADFRGWADSVQAFSRHPEVLGLGRVVIVPAAQLASFAARAAADPVAPLGPDGTLHVLPSGARPQYCLLSSAQTRNRKVAFAAGYDYCSGPLGALGFRSRDSGQGAYLPDTRTASHPLAVMTPIYRQGSAPSTVSARRAAFLGWVGMSVDPQVLLRQSLVGHPGAAVRLRYHADSSLASFRTGRVSAGEHATDIGLQGGWTVTTYAPIASSAIAGDSAALGILVAGLVAAVLLAVLILVLATARVRALGLVRARTDQLRHQALHDALTGLPNRLLIMDRITQLLARSERNGTGAAALYLDLDGFKNINDTLGHAAGDRLLQAVAERLSVTVREVDTIGRMGGDEFVVLVDVDAPALSPSVVAERLLEALQVPFHLDGVPLPIVITTSIGIAVGQGESGEDLLRQADIALYQAKAAGRNCYEVFGEQMSSEIERRYELEFDLRQAFEGHQYRLVYQPIYNLTDLTVCGVEALLRWEHPTRGLLAPDQFMPLLEASGQIIEVGRWVLREACEQMARWRADGDDLTISVNVSARQLDRDVIVDDVKDAIAASGLDPAALTIEITETAMMRNVEATTERLRQLKLLGVQIAIDDFGTGYSSMAYLEGFPVDCLKIDKAFTATIASSGESDALIRTLIQLGADLGLTTIAEGVETPGQVAFLRREHVDEVQGYLLARPLSAEALDTELGRLRQARANGPLLGLVTS